MQTTKSAVEILKEARGLIAAGWTQGNYCNVYSDMDLVECDELPPVEEKVPCFCMMGAIMRASRNAYFASTWPDEYVEDEERKAYQSLLAAVPTATRSSAGVIGWNDEKGRTQAEVLAAFDKAIALLETQPQA